MTADPRFDLTPYFKSMYNRAEKSLSVRGGSASELSSSQELLRQKLREVFALDIYGPRDTLPGAEFLYRETREGYSLEKFALSIAPGLTVPVYVLLPDSAKEGKKLPCAIALSGHGRGVCDILDIPDVWDRPAGGDYMKNFPIELCRRGIAVVAPEIIGFGESRLFRYMDRNKNGGACDSVSGMSLLWGGNAGGLRLFEAQRVLDWFLTLESVDGGRLGCMGISGGGTVATHLAAVDLRVGAAVVSGYANLYRDSIYAMHHCIDNYTPGMLRWAELPDVLALIAPRPLIISSGSEDRIFPVSATREAESILRPIWKTFGAEEKLMFDYFEGGHMISGPVLFDGMKDMLESL
ncbi:MAG: alpha/beta hydrolase family protein [Clostridiales bacterium]|nr:alpha/beta hydrolase family protein [Clostridiales bacterium]